MNYLISRFAFYYPSTLLKGEPIAKLMGYYERQQFWSEEQLRDYQLVKLKELLEFAFSHSPFYKNLYQEAGITPDDIRCLEDLRRLPSIDKSDLINQLDRMLPSKPHFLWSQKTTGGSTGEPVKLYKNPMALARERCATWRGYEWAGLRIGDAQLRFWGVPHDRISSWKAILTDLIANRRRISAFNLTEESLLRYYRSARKYKPRYLYGYVSVIEEFARFISQKGLEPIPSLRSVITTSEVLSPEVKNTIEASFKVRVFNEYGCGEVGSIAHECEKGSMHLMADNVIVEKDTGNEVTGELLVTDLFNYATPLIRYRLGDFATFSNQRCPCGRGLPVMESIHGRAYDILLMPDGRRVHPEAVIYVFEDIQRDTKAFKQFQIIQNSPSEILVKIVPADLFDDSIKYKIKILLESRLSKDIKYKFETVPKIPREVSGKMRVVKQLY